jgi:integrase
VLNWSVNEGLLAHNPVAGYKKPKRDDEIIQPVTREEARRILAASPPHLARALYISYYTGLRPGRRELLSLTWDKVDFDGNTIMVTSALKGGLKYRNVPLHKKLRSLLKKWFKEDQAGGKEDQPPDDWSPPTHIVHWRGQPIQSIKSAFSTAKTKAKISRKLTPYAFRHAFVSSILAAGGDLKSTSELVGHSRPDTTQRIYQHTNTRLHRESIDKLPGL